MTPYYLVLQNMVLANGKMMLRKDDKLTPIPQYRGYDAFGKDARNLFWTDDFLDKHPRLFRRVNAN
jgi:hypothetical protein